MKNVKRIVALVWVLALCLPLVGCRELEEMRAQQAFWNADGSISWQGDTYMKLPTSGDSYMYFNPPIDTTVYVTQPDVPVLLSSDYGVWLSSSEDRVFLSNDYRDGERYYYCRTDKFDEMVARLEKGFVYDTYTYLYWVYDEKTGEYDYAYYMLSEEQRDAVDRTINTIEPTVIPNDDSLALEFAYSVYLEKCSNDMLFADSTTIELCVDDGTYYVLDNYDEKLMLYKVAEADVPVFKAIMATYMQSAESMEDIDFDEIFF